MSEIRTTRKFQERFLDGYDRSQLRQDVQKVKPSRGVFSGIKKKYATWALGASLALGGLGVPMSKMGQHRDAAGSAGGSQDVAASTLTPDLMGDLQTAKSIADQVAGGVVAAAGGVKEAATAPLEAISETPKKLVLATDAMKEQFFKKEVPFGAVIYNEAKKNNLPPELVAAVVQAESRFKPTARSGAGAVGLMQLVPRTGKWMGARDLTNPVQNVAAGTKYLKYLNERFDGNQEKVIAAYNAGEGNVRRFGGVPPFRETRNYVKKVRTYEKEFAERVEGHAAEMTLVAADNALAR